MGDQIHFGDYIYISIKTVEGAVNLVTCDSFYSQYIWAGPINNISLKNYLSCLFQVCPIHENDHAEEKKFSHEGVDLKKAHEFHSEPLKVEEKFTLRHMQSGLFLEAVPHEHPADNGLKDLRLVSKPSDDHHFVVKSQLAGEYAKYGSPVHIFAPKQHLYLTHSSKEFVENDDARKFDLKNKYLNTDVFAKHPFRKQEAQMENESKFLVGLTDETENTVVLERYNAKPSHVLKTGEYFRLNNDDLYLTIHWYPEEGNLRELYYQSTDFVNYPHSQIYTVFSLVPIAQSPQELPQQEEISVLDPKVLVSEGSSLPDGLPVTKYLLRHYVTGYYLAVDTDKNLVLIPESELKNQESYWSEVVAVSKGLLKNNTLPQSHSFGIGFTNGSGVSFLTFSDEPYIISNVQLEKNTTYFFGFHIPDNYLNKKLKPRRKKIGFTRYVENSPVNFKAELVDQIDMRDILRTESLINQFCLFEDFLVDLKTPLSRKEHEYFKLNAQIEKQYHEEEAVASENQEGTLENAKIPPICNWNKLEKDTFLWMNRKIRRITDIVRLHLHKEHVHVKVEESPNVHEESKDHHHHHHTGPKAELTQVELWAAREFRILDQIYMILHYFIRDSGIGEEVKKLNEKNEKDPEFTHLDNRALISFLNACLELLVTHIKKDYLNHFYNSQFTRVNIHCLTTNEGLFSKLPQAEKYRTNELILEAACLSLWDDDLDALGQLNYYFYQIRDSIKEEEGYQALYIRLLEHQSRSKAPNLDNQVETSFIKDVLTVKEEREHMFPEFEDSDAQLVVKFIRYKNREGGPQKYRFLDLLNADKAKAGDSTDPDTGRKRELFEYLIHSLRLLNAMTESDNLLLYQTFVKHYPLKLLNKAIEETGDKCFELNVLLKQIISNVNMQYLHVPIKTFPAQIAVVGNSTFKKSIIEDTKKTAAEGLDTLLSDLETQIINQKEMLSEIEGCKMLLKDQLNQSQSKKMISIQNVHESDTLEFINAVRYTLSMSSKGIISLGDLLDLRVFLCKTIEKLQLSKNNSAAETIIEGLTTLGLVEDQLNGYSAQSIVEEIGKKTGVKLHETSNNVYFDITSANLESIISQEAKDWKAKEKSLAGKDDMMVQDNSQKYPSSSLVKTLLELALRKDKEITLEALRRLNKFAKFEKTLFSELKKFVIVADKADAKKISEVIKTTFKLNEYIRLYRCKTSNQIDIPYQRRIDIFNDINLKLNQLLFTIYDARKHFKYFESDRHPEEVFLEGYDQWKRERWDKCLKVNQAAVSKLFQRIFLALDIPKVLFQIIDVAISIKGDSYSQDDWLYLTAIRKAVFTLMVFVYKNKQSQDYLSTKKFMILSYYRQIYINQTSDVMLVFSEMMRDNRHLKKLPIKYLYDITWYTFFGTIERKIAGDESNSYLCTAIMAMQYLYELRIGKDNPSIVRDKIEQVLSALSDPSLDQFDLVAKVLSLKEDNQNVDEIKPLEVSFTYLSVREFFHCWDEISDQILGNDWEYINIMSDHMSYNKWDKVLANTWLHFQFELRNLYAKFIVRSWYPKQKTDILENQGNLNKLILRLLADLNEYIKFHAEHLGVKQLESYKPNYHWLNSDEIVAPHTQAYETFLGQQVYKVKMFIYAENITVHNLWHEYIYEGLIELLDTLKTVRPLRR